MKKEFLHPRFDGVRFEEHTLPLEIARDLAAFEVMILEVAKRLYLQDHPHRKRVPKGFDSAFHLHLERVDGGSARPVLSVVASGILALSGGAGDYFEQARDLIAECIASVDGPLPVKFPKPLLTHFNHVGRSLREGESMEIPRTGEPSAVLTPNRRKQLVLAAETFYEDEIEIAGIIEIANWKKDLFCLRLESGEAIEVPLPKVFRRDVGKYGGRGRFQVTVKGVGAFDLHGALQKMIKVRSIEVQPDFQIAAQLDKLGILAAGWHDGLGVALDSEGLSAVYEGLVGRILKICLFQQSSRPKKVTF